MLGGVQASKRDNGEKLEKYKSGIGDGYEPLTRWAPSAQELHYLASICFWKSVLVKSETLRLEKPTQFYTNICLILGINSSLVVRVAEDSTGRFNRLQGIVCCWRKGWNDEWSSG